MFRPRLRQSLARHRLDATHMTFFSLRGVRFVCASPCGVGLSAIACSSSKAAPSTSGTAAAPAPKLWGDLKPVVSVKELMRDVIDPASDYVFDGIGEIITAKGVIDKGPKTDEDWDRIRVGG